MLIDDPLILFCDEITTGLDSFNAISVIESLKNLVGLGCTTGRHKKAIICSVHQPSSNLFHEFTHMVLIAPGGKIAFQGKIEEAPGVFSKAGLNCPLHYNPAEFYIKVVSNPEDSEKLQGIDCQNTYRSLEKSQERLNGQAYINKAGCRKRYFH